MRTCAACGQENPVGFKFCGACGAPLTAPDVREERKIVTVLEEAYEILRDGPRRERYRRAIDARPEA